LSRAASFSLAIEFLPIRPIGRRDSQIRLDELIEAQSLEPAAELRTQSFDG
jgi:hypothetical protein